MLKERIAKRLAAAGVCSRREAEKFIYDHRIKVNGEVLKTPATLVTPDDVIMVDDIVITGEQSPRLWAFNKPAGLITTHHDPQGRPTLFQCLPETLPRVISIGRLDLNSEGLILLTTKGEIARHAELPSTQWSRCYRVRVFGNLKKRMLDELKNGSVVDGIHYGPIEIDIIKSSGLNSWLYVLLKEGKNREIRRVLNNLDLQVNRLIRVAYGPFSLDDLEPGHLKEIPFQKFSPYFPFLTPS